MGTAGFNLSHYQRRFSAEDHQRRREEAEQNIKDL